MDFNTRHYEWVVKKVFGGGYIYKTLTEDPMKNLVYDKLLNGTFTFQDDIMSAHKLWSKHMRSKVSNNAEPGIGKLEEQITVIDLRTKFLKAKEDITSRGISGLHRGIYKACTNDNLLATIQMTIVSLVFKFDLKGVSISRWHKAFN